MRHKKKRASQQNRNTERLDYTDDSLEPPNLDSQEYQEAIRAHLHEFEDMARNQTNGFVGDVGDLTQQMPKGISKPPGEAPYNNLPLLPSVQKSAKRAGKAANGANSNPAGGARANSKDRIWNTTTNEERERIKEFWLNLGEEERRSLVKVEKEAVLKKMKEQQKHSCSCSVCGRKRTAIEEELEVLYDAYYEELEQYANQQQFPSHTSIGSSRPRGPRHARPGRITEVLHSDDSDGSFDVDDDVGLSEDDLLTDDDLSCEDEEGYSEENEYEESHAPPEFFKFGNSLTVKGGILTVADDLLKNDGKKFIEMMEQLAERRMQREEEAALEAREYDEEDDDEDYDEEDEEDLDSDDYDEEDQEEQDALTEEQRMAEGRRMFQIFAARMFEQRVLTAYREKVAQERQAQLLQELEMEDSREKEREAKKAKEKEKKKDKKRQQQLKKEEEKARKDAERLAEEAALKAEEERKAEEARKKKEEQRLKRELEKKAIEGERLRKEEEKKKRIAEEKAREAKRLENLAKEKKAKEEALRKEREAKELAAKEAKAKKDSSKSVRESHPARLLESNNRSPPNTTNSNTLPSSAAGQTTNRNATRKPPQPAVANPSVSSTMLPVVPRPSAPAREGQQQQGNLRTYQEPAVKTAAPRNIPIPTQQHRARTPVAVSPQQQAYGSHQNSFPRAVLGHPPSTPVPLPPPGIATHASSTNIPHDPFGFNSPQGQMTHGIQGTIHARTNGPTGPPMQGLQGPPGVFAVAPGLPSSTSPQSRVGTPLQTPRLSSNQTFNAFSGLGASSTPRDDLSHEPDLTFTRRTSHLADNAIGAIGRPQVTRAPSALPAPIQRPTSIAPTKRTGFVTGNVMGSRALLDDDDAVVQDRGMHVGGTASLYGSTPSWTQSTALSGSAGFGSAALNDADDEPFHPSRSTPGFAQVAPSLTADRWGSVGDGGGGGIPSSPAVVGAKLGPAASAAGKGSSQQQQVDERFPTKPIHWGF